MSAMLPKWGERPKTPRQSGNNSPAKLEEQLAKGIDAWLSKVIESVSHIFRKENKTPIVNLIEKGYAYESVPWQSNMPYIWRFEVSDDELVIIYNSSIGDVPWVAYLNDKLTYKGNYPGILKRYPYVYDYIEYM